MSIAYHIFFEIYVILEAKKEPRISQALFSWNISSCSYFNPWRLDLLGTPPVLASSYRDNYYFTLWGLTLSMPSMSFFQRFHPPRGRCPSETPGPQSMCLSRTLRPRPVACRCNHDRISGWGSAGGAEHRNPLSHTELFYGRLLMRE